MSTSPRFPALRSRRRDIFRRSVAALLLTLVFSSATEAASSREKKEKDSGPVLLSRTGGAGGNSWANLKELQEAAAKGNPRAEAQLGEMLLRGDGIKQDEAKGVALLEKAARAGNSAAAFRIGMLLAQGERGVVKDPARALAYFRAGAAGGEAEAFFNLGAAYANGLGVKRDYSEALGWLIVARQRGADPATEQALRAQLQKTYPPWIARGEARAKGIEEEFAGKKVADYLPPVAPLSAAK